MKLVKLAAAAINQTPLDWDGNRRRIESILQQARREDVELVCLPELCITGYGCEDAFLSIDVVNRAFDMLLKIAEKTHGLIASLGLPIMHRGAIYNAVALVADGEVVGFVAKQHLAGDGIHYEPRWFKAWPENTTAELRENGESYPLGDLMFDVGGVRIGFEICEDAWVARRPGSGLAHAAADIILNPSASHFAFGKQEIRRRLVLEGARAFGVSYVYANLLGNEAGRAIYDGGTLIASGGSVLAEGPRLSFADNTLITAVADCDLTRIQRAKLASFQPHAEPVPQTVRIPFAWTKPDPQAPTTTLNPIDSKEHEFTRAVALGLFDYLRKSYCRGFVVSLSGGADSSAVAILSQLALRLPLQELGPAALAEKLPHLSERFEGATDNVEMANLMPSWLCCVYQATRNSSNVTRTAASELAKALSADYLEFDVDHIVQAYTRLGAQASHRELTWEQDDVSLQNIQARARAPGVWLLANLRGSLLLSTSNRSEAAVGYATMDGDTCGSVSPIAGIDKAFLRHWLRWMETVGPIETGPLSVLRLVNEQSPTAELRPADAGQTDETDLMPYEFLDAVERAAIRDKQSPIEVFRRMRFEFPDESPEQLKSWIAKFFRLWSRNQWKRERYAPSFHLDDKNLDPKTWCRFPILSGGFRAELAELEVFEDDEDLRDG